MSIIFTIRKIDSFEFLISLGAIFFLTFVLLIYLQATIIKAKELVLNSELRNIRIALNVYKGINDEYPKDLRELVVKEMDWTKLVHEIYKRPYLEHQRVDEQGFPIDPWDNRFVYNPLTGKINSATKGYEKW